MRCPKCGYISFDHLDRCAKCQTDLTGERLQLNLLGIKPNPISLQEILDRNVQPSSPKYNRRKGDSPIRPARSMDPEHPEFLLEDEFSLNDSISPVRDRGAKGPQPLPPGEGEIELSLDGLDLSLIPKKES